MWAIRALSGPLAGQIFILKEGRNVLGRGSDCDIQIKMTSISKTHAEITLIDGNLQIKDLDSRNGVFYKGVKVKKSTLVISDKFSLNDVIFDVVQLPDPVSLAIEAKRRSEKPLTEPTATAPIEEQSNDEPITKLQKLWATALEYFDQVAMPGIYSLAKRVEFRYVLLIAVGIYITSVTLLSSIPTTNLIRDSVQLESQRRAMTIAKNLAEQNRQALVERMDVNVSTKIADVEEGVAGAFIISGIDGHVIAPVNSRNSSLADKPFVHRARHEDNPVLSQIDENLIGASVPVKYYNSNQGNYSVLAHAIVLYDMGSISINRTKTAALFLQILALALVLGGVLFIFLVKVIEEPVRAINAQLSDALREGRDDVFSPFKSEALSQLVSNINSALNRIGKDSGNPTPITFNRDIEAENLVQSLPMAAMAFNVSEQRVISGNSRLNELLGTLNSLNGASLSDLASVDLSLQKNLQDLFERLASNPHQIVSDEIPFNGVKFVITAQAFMEGPSPTYILIWLQRLDLEGAA